MLQGNFLILCTLVFVFMANAYAQEPLRKPFQVYAFMPWNKVQKNSNEDVFAHNIREIKIVYEESYLDEGLINFNKIEYLAHLTILEPDIPLPFDMEFGNRFRPETVLPKAQAILEAYKSHKPSAPVGIYATIPQVAFSSKVDKHIYDKLNNQYKILVKYIDFLSPSLYNKQDSDFIAWSKIARYSIKEAKKYADGKPIIPFISPVYRMAPYNQIKNGYLVKELSEEEMNHRLQLLYELGVSGCIIWVSSQDRTQEGTIPHFSADRDWGKALVNFIKTH